MIEKVYMTGLDEEQERREDRYAWGYCIYVFVYIA